MEGDGAIEAELEAPCFPPPGDELVEDEAAILEDREGVIELLVKLDDAIQIK